MKPLANEFRRGGFRFRQICREGRFAIYEQTKPRHSLPHFEVVVIRQQAARVAPDGKILAAGERYPSSCEWGDLGWTFNEKEAAFKKLSQLVERQ